MVSLEQELERVYNRSHNFINFGETQIRIDPYLICIMTLIILFGILIDIAWNISNFDNKSNYYITCIFILMIVASYSSLIFHEFGHWLSHLYYGCKSDYLLLSYSICCVSSDDADDLSEWQKAVCAFAGPCTNLILCIVLGCFMHMYSDYLFNQYILEALNISFLTNGMTFIGNMFHWEPMSDGKRIFKYLKSVV